MIAQSQRIWDSHFVSVWRGSTLKVHVQLVAGTMFELRALLLPIAFILGILEVLSVLSVSFIITNNK